MRLSILLVENEKSILLTARLFLEAVGYTATVIAHRGMLEDGEKFMSKPITRDVLLQQVREVLDAR